MLYRKKLAFVYLFTITLAGVCQMARAATISMEAAKTSIGMEDCKRDLTMQVKVEWGGQPGDKIPNGNTIGGPATKTPVVVKFNGTEIASGNTNEPDGIFAVNTQISCDGGTLSIGSQRIVRFENYMANFDLPVAEGKDALDYGTQTLVLRK